MSKAQMVIEINGKRYDASTGDLIDVKPDLSHNESIKPGRNIDGIHHKPKIPKHNSIKPNHHHKPEHSHTLMRSAVKKPEHPQHSEKEAEEHLISRYHPKESRLASATEKSPHISRFGTDKPSVKKVSQVLPVKDAPIDEPFVLLSHGRVENPPKRQEDDLINKALEKATAHTNPKLKKSSLRLRTANRLKVSPRIVSVSAMTLSVLLLVVFFAYQNSANLAMHVAAATSGVHASLPSYQPSGFSLLDPIRVKSGQVTVSYKSNSDDRHFSISQQKTGWDSQNLLLNYVQPKKSAFQTYQTDNKTIYIYDANNATWVENGIWYKVEGQSSLSSDQLLRIAASM